jgi:hypothetical protein
MHHPIDDADMLNSIYPEVKTVYKLYTEVVVQDGLYMCPSNICF